MFNRYLLSMFLLIVSNIGFSQISKYQWVRQCKNATGERKITFDAILDEYRRITPGYERSCSKVYDVITYVESINICDKNIKDLSPIAGFTNTKKLLLYNNKISDLSPLTGLKKLKEIALKNNHIRDISPLAGLIKVEKLDLRENLIINISPITQLTGIRSLHLNKNQIFDLRPLLSISSNITTLSLEGMQIQDLSLFAGFTSLESLCLQNTKISDLTPLAGLKKLKWLGVAENQIQDISPISNLTNLKDLSMSENQISDISPLAGLKNLRDVHLGNNRISDFRSVNHVEYVAGKDKQKPTGLFYQKLIQESSNIDALISKLKDLPDLIEDVHQMKFYYSLVMYSYRTGLIDQSMRNISIKKGLNKSAFTVLDSYTVAVFKAILDKALNDEIILITDYRILENKAEDKKTSKMPFIRDLQRSVQENTAAIEGLKGDIQTLQKNIIAVNQSLNNVKQGVQTKMNIEAGVGFAGFILNAVTFGVAGSALQSFMASTMADIIDFSDFAHLQEVTERHGQGEIFSQIEDIAEETDIADVIGWKISAVGLTSHMKLQKALHEENPLVMIAAIAAKIEQVKNKKPSISFANSTNIEVDEDDNGISDDEDDDNGFSDDEEETVFELIDAGNLDGLAEYLNQFETKEDLNRAFKNEVKEKNENSLKYAIRVKNTDAVRIIGEKAVSLDIIPKKKLDKYIRESN